MPHRMRFFIKLILIPILSYLIPVVAASDYDGFIVTEYEDEGGYDAIEQTTRHVAMVKTLLNQ